MAENSSIEWTDTTWNPVTGCTKISAGCDNCYAARFSERFRGVPGHPFETGFDLTLRPETDAQPLTWKRPRMIFVNSMSDLFHKEVPRRHIAGFRYDGKGRLARLSGAHQAQLAALKLSMTATSGRHRRICGLGFRRERAGLRGSRICRRQGTRPFPFREPLIAPVGQSTSRRHSLGDRRRRERARCATDGGGLGD